MRCWSGKTGSREPHLPRRPARCSGGFGYSPQPFAIPDRQDPASKRPPASPDRKSTRLNFSHLVISYAVFCFKKKKQKQLVGAAPLSMKRTAGTCADRRTR